MSGVGECTNQTSLQLSTQITNCGSPDMTKPVIPIETSIASKGRKKALNAKKWQKSRLFVLKFGGESGIRTHGGFPLGGFQDRCHRPLSHLSQNHFLFFSPGGEATYYGTGILYCKTRFTRKTRRGVTRRARKAPAAHTEGTEWRPMLRMDRLVFLRDLEI